MLTILAFLPIPAVVAALGLYSPAPLDDAASGLVSLRLSDAHAGRHEGFVRFECVATLDNATGRELSVRSPFASAFDGLEIVVTDREGTVLVQRAYTAHQAPYAPTDRRFPLRPGRTRATLIFPVVGLPAEATEFKVRLVGTLPGSDYVRILSTETRTVRLDD